MSLPDLTDKIALVTGSSRGIGRGTAVARDEHGRLPAPYAKRLR